MHIYCARWCFCNYCKLHLTTHLPEITTSSSNVYHLLRNLAILLCCPQLHNPAISKKSNPPIWLLGFWFFAFCFSLLATLIFKIAPNYSTMLSSTTRPNHSRKIKSTQFGYWVFDFLHFFFSLLATLIFIIVINEVGIYFYYTLSTTLIFKIVITGDD